METRLMHTCYRLRPGITLLEVFFATSIGLAVGGAAAVAIASPVALVALLGGTFGFPLITAYIGFRDSSLSDDECTVLLESAETTTEKAWVRDLYRQKGFLLKSDANRILERLHQEQHVSLQQRMEAAG